MDSTDADTITDREISLRPAVPWLVVTLALGVLALVIGVVRLDALPDPYPTHFGPAGDADRFTDRSPASVLLPAVVGQLTGLSVFATLLLMRRGAQQVVTPLAALGCTLGGGIAAVSIAQYLSDDAVPPPWAFWLLVAGILASTTWVVAVAVAAGRDATGEHTGWRWGGLVYANREDPAVLVPYRAGTGVTINFGRPLGWALFALVLAPGALLVVAVVLWV